MCILVALVAGLPLTWLSLRLADALASAPVRHPGGAHCARRRYRGLLRYLLIAALLTVTLALFGEICATVSTPRTSIRVLLASLVVLIIVVDLEHRRIPHAVQLPAFLLALLLAVETDSLSRALPGAVAGTLLGGLILAGGELYRRAHVRLRGTRLRTVAFGAGDAVLAGLCGLVAGWPLILPALLTAIVSAGLVALLLLLTGRAARHSSLPYAPFLLGGALLVMRFPEPAARFLASFG